MSAIDPLRAVIAVALSVVLWYVVQTEANPERQDVTVFTVPVEVVNAPPGLQTTSEPPGVRVSVRATDDVWRRLEAKSFRAVADAATASQGTNDLPVRIEALVEDIRGEPQAVPATVPVRLEQVTNRSVAVRVVIEGGVPFGYNYAPPQVSPEKVTVTGPSSAVERVVAAVVDLALDGVTVSVDSSYAPRPVDGSGQEVRNVQIVPPSVNMQVQVSQQVRYKQVGVRPVTTGVPAAGYFVEAATVDPASATLVGNPASLTGVDFIETRPVDVSGASNSVVQTAELNVPGGVSLLQPVPVNVTVRISPLQVQQTLRVPMSVTGLGAGVELASELPEVDVTVVGPAPTLRGLNPRDLQVLLDLSALGAGTHSVSPRVVLPQALTLQDYAPREIRVTLVVPTPTPLPTPTATPSPIPTPATPAQPPAPGV